MEYALKALQPYYKAVMDELVKDCLSGLFRDITECPAYEDAKALAHAMDILTKASGGNPVLDPNEYVSSALKESSES